MPTANSIAIWAVAVLLLPFSASAQVGSSEAAKTEDVLLQELDKVQGRAGSDSWDTAIVLSKLARFYREQKEFAAAAPFYERVLAIGKKVHGENSPLEAPLVQELASVYRALNRADDAESLEKHATPPLANSEAPYVRAKQLEDAKHYPEALPLYQQAAAAGHADAMNDVGRFYANGWGVLKDYEEAMRWYRKASDAGSAKGTYNIGRHYQNGSGVARDYAEAMRWYRKAADAGNARAMYGIAWLYNRGLGVPQDYEEAMRWYRKASDAGDAIAMNNIGDLYQNGGGVTQDYVAAMSWYQKAADAGNTLALVGIGELYRDGLGVTQDYAAAMSWYRKSADAGNARGMDQIGWLYQNGLGVARNYEEAMRWYRKAADAGDARAMVHAGFLYQAAGVMQDYAEAMRWFRKGADAGSATAMNSVGWLYHNGWGVARDDAEAMLWFRKGADAGGAAAMNNIGWLYQNGWGVPADRTEAIAWYRKAAAAGDTRAKANLKNLGVEPTTINAPDLERPTTVPGTASAATPVAKLEPATLGQPMWPMDGGNPERTGYAPYRGPRKPKIAWSVPRGNNSADSPLIGPDGRVYVWNRSWGQGESGPGLTCIEGSHIMWKITLEVGDDVGFGSDGSILLTSDHRIRKLNRDGAIAGESPTEVRWPGFFRWDGHPLGFDNSGITRLDDRSWHVKLNGQSSYPVVNNRGVLSVGVTSGTDAGNLIAVSEAGVILWKFSTGSGILGLAVTAERDLLAVNNQGLYCVRDGQLRWKFSVNGNAHSPIHDQSGTIFFGSGFDFYAVTDSGQEIWRIRLGDRVTAGAAMDRSGRIYVLTMNHLYCISDVDVP